VKYIAAAHQYQIEELANGLACFLEEELTVENVVDRYRTAALYELNALKRTCLRFMDKTAVAVLQSASFLELSEVLTKYHRSP
jgi:hypothetical protein